MALKRCLHLPNLGGEATLARQIQRGQRAGSGLPQHLAAQHPEFGLDQGYVNRPEVGLG
jgi:hypothetical protein